MSQRLRDRVTFVLERLMLRGAQWRILVIALAIGLISILGGALVLAAPRAGPFHEEVWWAFLRLTDPGYLGDDVGTWRRIVSTLLTVVGYVIFLGALIAVMTQWLNALMRNLERGLTPIVESGHILILGWSDRTPTIVRELLVSEGRVRRFLRRHQARSLRVVILAEEVGPQHVIELRDSLGDLWDGRRIIFRSGSPLRIPHLARTDFLHASVIVIPGVDFASVGLTESGAAAIQIADSSAIKIILSIANSAAAQRVDELPQIVAEIADSRKALVAERVYAGPVEVVASDLFISRLITQNVRNRGLSHLTAELFAHGPGNEIYVREHPALAGRTVAELPQRFRRAIVIGLVRRDAGRYRPLLSPDPGVVLGEGDRLVLVARHYEDTDPSEPPPREAVAVAAPVRARPPQPQSPRPLRRILVLGWNHRVPALVAGFGSYELDSFQVDIASVLPVAERERELAQYGVSPVRVPVRQIQADYTVPTELARLDPASYGTIILLGSNWLPGREESDARTVLGYLLLRELIGTRPTPHVIAELMDPGNLALFREHQAEVLVSSQIISRILAQVTLRPELGPVFDELFGPSGCAIVFRTSESLGLAGRELGFEEVQAAVTAAGGVALGLRIDAESSGPTGGIRINPSREKRWTLLPDDQVIVLDERGA
ncbi:MAG TPA: TrkA C-terminal domain-containing protein [Gemmatimonadales bacterium]